MLEQNGVDVSLVVVDTAGDRALDVSLDRVGGQGIFVKEVQAAVVSGRADAAVHSAKDLPAALGLSVPGLVLAAFPERKDPRDVLVGGRIATLPTGATIATGSARRRVQLANFRPDLTFTGLRGNLATRLAVAESGGVGTVVVAKAALDRMEWEAPEGLDVEVLPPRLMLPQVGQGALAVECRSDDEQTVSALAAVDDPEVRPLVIAERAFLAELGGGCTLPVGAMAAWVGAPGASAMALWGMLASQDGVIVLRHRADTGSAHPAHAAGPAGPADTAPTGLGRSVARYLLHDLGGWDLADWAGPEAADPSGGHARVPPAGV